MKNIPSFVSSWHLKFLCFTNFIFFHLLYFVSLTYFYPIVFKHSQRCKNLDYIDNSGKNSCFDASGGQISKSVLEKCLYVNYLSWNMGNAECNHNCNDMITMHV